MIAELFDVLQQDKVRKYLPLDRSVEDVEWHRSTSELVVVTRHIVACCDPKDDKFLSFAVSGKADCIGAGDYDFIDMVTFDDIPIYRPAEFVRLFARPAEPR